MASPRPKRAPKTAMTMEQERILRLCAAEGGPDRWRRAREAGIAKPSEKFRDLQRKDATSPSKRRRVRTPRAPPPPRASSAVSPMALLSASKIGVHEYAADSPPVQECVDLSPAPDIGSID
jgi:hypothetical protein